MFIAHFWSFPSGDILDEKPLLRTPIPSFHLHHSPAIKTAPDDNAFDEGFQSDLSHSHSLPAFLRYSDLLVPDRAFDEGRSDPSRTPSSAHTDNDDKTSLRISTKDF
ncbi:hypothetical protein BV22DRAFT_1135216 [Leucogyrophana mollusca]|uniref:Uncharacterized protein n=1 Tax=Leucogyrophana mollusca TaxID=85980 RepID=A0ACB8AWA8_9AGAM|nr:hypothetical protein BV22DRAFT_1135216 [Leucogyrophana mollusca]